VSFSIPFCFGVGEGPVLVLLVQFWTRQVSMTTVPTIKLWLWESNATIHYSTVGPRCPYRLIRWFILLTVSSIQLCISETNVLIRINWLSWSEIQPTHLWQQQALVFHTPSSSSRNLDRSRLLARLRSWSRCRSGRDFLRTSACLTTGRRMWPHDDFLLVFECSR